MPINQGRNGYVSIGGVKIPVYSWRMESPDNLVAPVPVGNTWQTAYAEGLQTGAFTASLMLRKKATECLASSFWDLFMLRTWSAGFDDTATTTIVASDSVQTHTMANAKAEAFVLRIAKGRPVGLDVTFLSPAPHASADISPAMSAYAQFDGSSPLMEYDVTMGGITGNWYSAEISYANGHVANAPGNGTKNIASWDAGAPRAGLAITVNARLTAGEPFASGGTVTASLAGTAITRLFTLKSVIPGNPKNRGADLGAVYRTYQCLVLGTDAIAPLVVS